MTTHPALDAGYPRTKPIREAKKVFLIDLVEDGDHGMLD